MLAIVALGTIAAFSGVAKVSAAAPARDAAEREMRRIITLSQTATKYADPRSVSINGTPWRTAMPNPNGTPVPLTVTATKAVLSNGRYALTISIGYPSNGTSATLTKTIPLVQKAPPPDTQLTAPGLYADPTVTPTP